MADLASAALASSATLPGTEDRTRPTTPASLVPDDHLVSKQALDTGSQKDIGETPGTETNLLPLPNTEVNEKEPEYPRYVAASVNDVRHYDPRFKELKFKPIVLKTWTLVLFIVFSLAVLVAITVVSVKAYQRQDSWYPSSRVDARLIQLVPGIIGSMTNLWWQAIIREHSRLSPYLKMADRDASATNGRGTFKAGLSWPLWCAYFLTIFIVPLKSLFIWVDDPDGDWEVTPDPLIGIPLGILYVLFIGVLIWILVSTRHDHTGLMHDPVSIADQLWLYERMNLAKAFANTDRPPYEDDYLDKTFRLGYWEVIAQDENGERSAGYRYGIRYLEGQDKTKFNRLKKWTRARDLKKKKEREIELSQTPTEQLLRDIRFSSLPFWSSPLVLFGASLLSIIMFTLLNVALGVNHWTQETNLISINAGNAMFQFLTSLLGSLLLALDQNIDAFYRTIQPFAGMYPAKDPGTKLPNPAEDTLLLGYPSQLPGIVTLSALRNKHYKLALASLVALLSQLYPVLLGGMYVGVPPHRVGSKNGEQRGSYNSALVLRAQPIYWVVYAFTLLHVVHPLVMVPWGERWYLPGGVAGLADVVRYSYASEVVNRGMKHTSSGGDGGEVVAVVVDDPTDRRKHFVARLLLRKGTYVFGTFTGTDGKVHVGFDVDDPGEKRVDGMEGVKIPMARRLFKFYSSGWLPMP